MKKIILIVMMTLCAIQLNAAEPSDKLMDAMKLVESGAGDQSDAVGDGGKAIGPLQIWKVYFQDAIEFNEDLQKYKYEDVKDYKVAKLIVKAYMKRYATKKRIGRKPTDEDMARIHNKGPNGYKKQSSLAYWKKVKKSLK